MNLILDSKPQQQLGYGWNSELNVKIIANSPKGTEKTRPLSNTDVKERSQTEQLLPEGAEVMS